MASSAITRGGWLAGAAGATALPRRAFAQTPTVRVSGQGQETYAEALYGIDAGLFARAGLDVVPTIFSSAGGASAALAGNAIDVGLIDAIVLANAANRGVPIVALAGAGLFRTSDPTSGLYVLKSAPIASAKALEGGTIAVGTLVSLTTISLKMWLSRNGADVDKVRFTEMPFPAMPAALERNDITAAYLVEPFIVTHLDVRLLAVPYSAIADTFLISVACANRNWIEQNADVAKRFVGAFYETARWANTHRDETATTLAKYSKIRPDLIRRMQRTEFATALTPALLQPILDAAYTYKLIGRPTSAVDLIAHTP